MWLMLGFLVAFAVKLPAVPLHTWLPDAHTQAPAAGSVILAGLVLKVGGYGMLRFLWPLFPQASAAFATTGMIIGVVGILYGALMAFAQTDVKRLVAYSSVSHMGFVMLGVFAWNRYALAGALVVMLAHGVSTGALFTVVGQMYQRLHTRDMDKLGGLWAAAPRMGGVWLFFAAASLGLPGLGNFVGEVLVLAGVFAVSPAIAAVAALGMVASAIYSLWMVQRVLHGPNKNKIETHDLSPREWAIHATLIAATLWLGLYPQTFINMAMPAFERMTGTEPKRPMHTIMAIDGTGGCTAPGTAASSAAVAPGMAQGRTTAAPNSGVAVAPAPGASENTAANGAAVAPISEGGEQ
jgi:NADH-quinone oxidoreductase subunit M